MRIFRILDYIDYDIVNAKKSIEKEFDWKDYGGKHHESIFTKFYQSYLLPQKFKIDKRRAHLSSLICSNQITRQQAMKIIERSIYNQKELERDKNYILKKFMITDKEFDEIMKEPIRKHSDFKSNALIMDNIIKLYVKLYTIWNKS